MNCTHIERVMKDTHIDTESHKCCTQLIGNVMNTTRNLFNQQIFAISICTWLTERVMKSRYKRVYGVAMTSRLLKIIGLFYRI